MTNLVHLVLDHAVVLGLAVSLLGAFVTAYLQRRGYTRGAKALQAITTGTRAGLADLAQGKDPQLALVDAVMAAARGMGVEDHPAVTDHVDAIRTSTKPD